MSRRPCNTCARPPQSSSCEPVSTRIVSFGGSSVRIDHTGRAAARLVDFLYRDIPGDVETDEGVVLQLHSSNGQFVVESGQELRYRGTSAAGAAGVLLHESIFHLANHNRTGLLLHAAAVQCRGGCLLLPGQTGAGKTTLTAWLSHQGLDYLTDELVYIPLGTQDVQSFRRPMNVKASARHALEGILELDGTRDILKGPDATLVRAGAGSGCATGEAQRLAGVVFPRYQAGNSFELAALTKGRTALRLAECLINARNLPDRGLEELARLAVGLTSYELRYSEFRQLHTWVASLLPLSPRRSESQG